MIDKSIAQVFSAWVIGPVSLSLANVRDGAQIGAAVVVIGFTIWRWNRDRKNER